MVVADCGELPLKDWPKVGQGIGRCTDTTIQEVLGSRKQHTIVFVEKEGTPFGIMNNSQKTECGAVCLQLLGFL